MFEDYMSKLYEEPAIQPKYETLTIGNTVMTPYILEEKLSNISNLSNRDLYEILMLSYSTILNRNFIDKNKAIIARLFTNERFVSIFSQTLNSVPIPFTEDQKISCNKLIYDYIVYNGNKKSKSIMSILYKIGKTINRDMVPILCALNLPERTAIDLIIAAFSTSNEFLAMQRVNVVIMNNDIDIMTEQMIVWIYEKLFNHLTQMFEGIMFDVWNEDDFINEDKEEIYGRINLAILDILQEAPMKFIVSVISSFSQDRYYVHSKDPIRFNIKSISVSDYGRIIKAIDIVENERGFKVPEV